MVNTSCNTVAVLGVPFHNVTMDETIALIEEHIREGGFHQIATANVDFLRNAMRNKKVHDILCSCEVVIPDGMPIVWMSRLLGTALKERVSGIDLVERLADVSSRRGYRVFMLGASESRSQRAAKMLKTRYPDLNIVGRFSPEPRPLNKMDHEEILRRIEEARPDILLVAFGNPKQEEWISMHRDRLNVPVCIGVGGSLDFISGKTRRAPRWMQRTGLEWFHRMAHEPQRLATRYMGDSLCLVRHLPGQMASAAVQRRKRQDSRILSQQIGNTKLITLIGDIRGSVLEDFKAAARDAGQEGMNMVLDMSDAAYVGAECLGTLIALESRMRRRREQLWLAELPPRLTRILRRGQLHNYFMTTTMVSDALYRTAKAEQRLLASFTPPMGISQEETAFVDVRVELLQDVCRRIIATNETGESTFVPAAAEMQGR